jgi:quercetin dioxygenase-like cupin family protein
MNADYTFFSNLADPANIPADGILSRTIYSDDQMKAVLFGFSTGEELSEHTASSAAIIHIVQGDARLTLGNDTMEASAGTWVHMPPRLPHSVYAKTPVVMLLLMFKT